MELYILRHAIAVPRGTPGYPNDDRPLTDEGIAKMKKNAEGIRRIVPGFDVILTSPLKRAYDTARITAEAVNCVSKIKVIEQLLPGRSIQDIFSALSKMKNRKRILLVGHEPNLGEFTSALTDAKMSAIDFKKGALCRIDVGEIPHKLPGIIIWHLPPKILRMIAKS